MDCLLSQIPYLLGIYRNLSIWQIKPRRKMSPDAFCQLLKLKDVEM